MELQVPQLGQIQESPSEVETDTGFDSGLAHQYLSSVDEADRAIVEKYIKGWDGEVTKKFQSYSEKLKPYEELGVDIDSIKYAVQTMRFAEQDPKGFYEAVAESLKEMGLMEPENTPVGGSPLPEYDGLPDNFVSEFQSLKKELTDLREFKSNLETERQTQSQQQQLDNLLKDMETKHGKFDQAAVMGRMLQGMSAEDAVKDYQKLIKEISTPATRTPPPILGGGRTAVEQVDSSKIRNDKKARTSLVADLLNRSRD